MNDQPTPKINDDKNVESERTKQVGIVGWTVGLTAFFTAIALINEPIWPVAFGMAVVTMTVAVVCCYILKRS